MTHSVEYLKPSNIFRTSMATVFGIVAAIGLLVLAIKPSLWILAAILLLSGAYLAFRATRISLILAPATITIRGLIASKSIAKGDVTDVSRLPYIGWRDSNGVSHDAAVFTYMSNRSGQNAASRQREAAVARLTAWKESQ